MDDNRISEPFGTETFALLQGGTLAAEQFLSLIGRLPTGIGIFDLTETAVVQVYLNDAFYQMLGTSREERTFYTGTNTLLAVHPDDVPRIRAAVREVLAGRETVEATHRHRHADGSWFWLHLKCTVAARREGFARILCVFSDHNGIVRARQELESSRTAFKTALRSAKVLTWRYDPRTRCITDSLTLGDTYGLPKTIENAPQTILNMGFIADESVADFLHLYERLETEDNVSIDTKANTRDEGGYVWYRQMYTKNFDTDGNCVDCIGVAIDITEQKRREQRYEEQLRLNESTAQDAVAKVYLNLTRNRISFYDSTLPEFKAFATLPTADALLDSVRQDTTHAETLKKFEAVADCNTIIRAYKQGTTHIEITCHLHDTVQWVRVVYDTLENPYTGDIETISSIHDVTDQIRSELVIHRLMDVDYKSILLIDNQTGIASPFKRDSSDTNVAEINGGMEQTGSQDEGLEAFFRAHALPDKVEEVIRENSPATIYKALETSPFYDCMYALRENGCVKQYKVTYSYLESDRRILLSAVQDVTKLYEKELRQKNELAQALVEADAASRAKTAFLSRISHDMRTPLNGILGLTTLLKGRITEGDVLDDLTDLETSGKYLLNLINDTLDMSRIESGRLELHPVVCDGRAFFASTMGLARTSIEAKGLRHRFHADNIPFTMLCDDTARIEQVIMNVVSNAVKFTPADGFIDIALKNVSVKNGVITDQVIVRDTGIGMSPEFLPHLFEDFSQEDATRTSAFQGTGLGMPITKQLLDLMGGGIEVESAPGKGSCFTITLHLHMATPQQIADWKKKLSGECSDAVLASRHILLCEDHPLNARIATHLLEKRGMLVDHAENGLVGCEMLRASAPGHYDAVLMDIRMPVMDGLDATRTIRAMPRPDVKTLPIIAMTANAFAEDIAQTRAAGMDAHLSKPIETEVLYRTLAEVITRSEGR